MSNLRRAGLIALAMIVATAPALAGQGQGRGGAGGPGRDGGFGRRGPMGPNLERVVTVAMENRSDLQLTEAQVGRLQTLLDEFKGTAAVAAESREQAMDQLRSGELTREEMRERRSEESAAFRELAQQYHGRLDEILSQAQRDQVHGIMMRNVRGEREGARGHGRHERSRKGGGRRG